MADTHLLKRVEVVEERSEKARKAVQEFRALQPTLSAYARVLTGKPNVRVEMSANSNGSTDGSVIYYRPPMELGDKTPHERRLCDKRNELDQLRCRACAIREHVLVVIYHEIAHIAFGTFEETTEEAKAVAIQRAVTEVGGKYAEQIKKKIQQSARTVTGSYLGLSSLISPFLPVLVNALEDARVNNALFNARKGTRIMFNADTQNIFAEGVEQKNEHGEVVKVMWKDYPLNAQVSVGVFCKAADYKYKNWFAPVVVQALDDPELTEIISRLDAATGPADSYELSFPILARLRELGFCKSASDPEPEPEEKNEPGGSTEDSSGDNQGSEDETSDGGPRSPASEVDAPKDDGQPSGAGHQQDADDAESGEQDSSAEATQEGGSGGDERPDKGPEVDGSEEQTGGSDSSEDSGNDVEEASSGDQATPPGGQSSDGSGSGGGKQAGDGVDEDPSGSPEADNGSDQSASPGDSGDGGDVSRRQTSSGLGEGDIPPGQTGEELDSSDNVDQSGDAGSPGGLEHLDERDENPLGSVGTDGEQDRKTNDSSAQPSMGDDNDSAPIDTGADEGLGGIQLIIPEDANMGDADEAMGGLLKVEQHEDRPQTMEMREDNSAIEVAIIQGFYFETPSSEVVGVRENRYGKPLKGFSRKLNSWQSAEGRDYSERIRRGIDGDFDPKEEILGPALLRMRVVFTDNQRGSTKAHLKSGKINARVLGKRAPVMDPRLFKKRTQPGKKDYFVLIGVDISGSTTGQNLVLTKKAVMAQCELLSRMGIKFAVYAHSGVYLQRQHYGSTQTELDIYIIKEAQEPWSTEVKNRLRKLGPYEVNLDGHALEYFRKVLDRVQATDKIILYYSDGKMPAENFDEELEILRREIQICHKKNYTLLGVGIRTDSPARHGLDTVQVDRDEDLVKVVRHLEKRLTSS